MELLEKKMGDFISTTGAVIATYLGTGISIISAIIARRDKNAVEKYKNEIVVRFQSNELTKLYGKSREVKEIVSNYSSKTRKTKNGLNESNDKKIINNFLTEINENKHLIKSNGIENLISEARKLLDENKYDNLLFCVSDIISKIKEITDKNFIR